MQIKVKLSNTRPDFLENLLPIISEKLLIQIKDNKKILVIDQSEYDALLTELSALKNHSEEYNSTFQKEVDFAIEDFMTRWQYVFEGSS